MNDITTRPSSVKDSGIFSILCSSADKCSKELKSAINPTVLEADTLIDRFDYMSRFADIYRAMHQYIERAANEGDKVANGIIMGLQRTTEEWERINGA